MKLRNNLLVAALAAVSLGSASATTTYLTGSTAFQSQTDKAITNYISATGGTVLSSDSATLGSEVNIVFNYGSPATNYIICHWSGSEGGFQNICSPSTNTVYCTNFLSSTNSGGLGGTTAASATNSAAVQIAMSDTFATSTQFKGTYNGNHYGTPSKDYKVALQGFAFCASTNIPITNVTSQQIRALYSAGAVSLAFFTGNPADQTNTVWAVGRNPDSGTRVQAQSESGIGGLSTVLQMSNSSGVLYKYPAGSVDGISFNAGNNGYASTGTLLAAVTNNSVFGATADGSGIYAGISSASDGTGSNFVIGYAAAGKFPSPGLVELTYNGVAASTANITNGLYSFWGYEHIMVSPYYADATASNVASGMNTFLSTNTSLFLGTGNASMADGNANVTRTADGGVITQVY